MMEDIEIRGAERSSVKGSGKRGCLTGRRKRAGDKKKKKSALCKVAVQYNCKEKLETADVGVCIENANISC